MPRINKMFEGVGRTVGVYEINYPMSEEYKLLIARKHRAEELVVNLREISF
jgi:hypothetical protein